MDQPEKQCQQLKRGGGNDSNKHLRKAISGLNWTLIIQFYIKELIGETFADFEVTTQTFKKYALYGQSFGKVNPIYLFNALTEQKNIGCEFKQDKDGKNQAVLNFGEAANNIVIDELIQSKEEYQESVILNLTDQLQILKDQYQGSKAQKAALHEENIVQAKASFDSVLIPALNEDFRLLLNKFFGTVKIRFELLYRASRDGLSAAQFHAKCDGRGATLVLVKSATQEKLFGGYASASWNSTGGWIDANFTQNSFLFSFLSGFKYVIFKNVQTSLCGIPSYGPYFGNGNGLIISNNGTGSTSQLGECFSRNGLVAGSEQAKTELAGANSFNVQEYEVFRVTFL